MQRFCAAVLIAGSAFAQNSTPTGSVEGSVVNSATGAGVDGASVTFFSPAKHYETTSDAAGHFTMSGIAPGNYRASAKKDGYGISLSDFSLSLNAGVRIGTGPDPVKVTLTLTTLSTFHGRVLDPDGNPLPGAEVSFVPNFLGSVTTDREGRFAFEEVRPGSYILSAWPAGNLKSMQLPDGSRIAMVTTYFPSVTDISLTEKIVFRGETDLSGYEIRMQTAPVLRVRGVVLNEDGKPSSEAEVSLLPNSDSVPGLVGLGMRAGGPFFFALGVRPPPGGMPEYRRTAGPDGRFEFPAVRPGDWKINAESSSMRQRGTTTTRVRRSDIDDIEIRLATRFNLTAAIEWKGEDRRPPSARILSGVALVNSEGEFVRSGIEESGSLLFENVLPGAYRMLVSSGLAAHVFSGTTDVTNQAFSVSPEGPPLRVVLQTRSGTIRGTVEKGGGATVVLVPQGPERPAIGESIESAADGSFELNQVSPGDYTVAAFEPPPGMPPFGGLPPSALMLDLMPARGVSVKVEDGSATNVTLPLISLPK